MKIHLSFLHICVFFEDTWCVFDVVDIQSVTTSLIKIHNKFDGNMRQKIKKRSNFVSLSFDLF